METPDALQWLDCELAIEAMHMMFAGMLDINSPTMLRMAQDARSLSNLMTKQDRQNTSKMVCIDDIMQLTLRQWEVEFEKATEFLEALFAGGDIDRDGSLDFEEFSAIVLSVDSTFTVRQISRMFREALHYGEEDEEGFGQITPGIFAKVSRKHGLARKKTLPTWQMYRRRGSMNNIMKMVKEESSNSQQDGTFVGERTFGAESPSLS